MAVCGGCQVKGGKGGGAAHLLNQCRTKPDAWSPNTKHREKLGEGRVSSLSSVEMKKGKVGSGAEQSQHMGKDGIPGSRLVVKSDKQSCDDEVQGIRHHDPGQGQLRQGKYLHKKECRWWDLKSGEKPRESLGKALGETGCKQEASVRKAY